MGADKIKKLAILAEELLEKWSSCDGAQVTEGLQSVNELWEQFEEDLLEREKVVHCMDAHMITFILVYVRACICPHTYST